MKELSLHILDLAQNSIQANAKLISISIIENTATDQLTITITDNGKGMSESTINKILDPFFTTKNKKTGLGIPLLKQHAELTSGDIIINSKSGKGTTVKAFFTHSHVDRQPLGDIAGTLMGLIRSYPELDFEYYHKINEKSFSFTTNEIKKELDEIPLSSPEVIKFIKEMLKENLEEIMIK